MNPNQTIRIVIADDHQIVREGFKLIFLDQEKNDLDLVAEASNGLELINVVEKYNPHIVMTDVRMPAMDGIQASKIILEKFPSTSVIAFSFFDDTNTIMRMVQAGARGYVVKTSSKEEIIEAIKTVARGEFYYCSTISSKIFGTLINSKAKKLQTVTIAFTSQEIKIIKLICKQQTTKEIAATMGLAERTVETYRKNIQEKTGSRNAVGIAIYGLLNDLIPIAELLFCFCFIDIFTGC